MRRTNRNSLLLAIALVAAALMLKTGASWETEATHPVALDEQRKGIDFRERSLYGLQTIRWREDTENPFAIKYSGLPSSYGGCTVGEPQRISGIEARKVASRTFSDAGYHLEANYKLRRDGLSFTADGYDPDKRVGYVVADYSTLDEDAFLLRLHPYNDFLIERDRLIKAYRNREKELLAFGANNASYGRIQAILDASERVGDVSRQTILRAEAATQIDALFLSLREAAILDGRESESHEFIAIISEQDHRLFRRKWHPAIENLYKEAARIRIPKDAKLREIKQQVKDHPEQAGELEQERKKIESEYAARIAELKQQLDAAEKLPASTELDVLADLCRQYIRWARQQGAK